MAQPPNPRASLLTQRVARWNQTHPGRTIDPQAELAVARQEGLGGGIGDQGTSFGPNQLHYGGAYPSFAPRGAQASQAWAWSPAGIDYTLAQIANVAGGEHGGQAVRDIVTRFERPANPGRETANALAAYGGSGAAPAAPGGSWGPGTVPDMAAPVPPDNRRRLLLALAGTVGEAQPNFTPLLEQLVARQPPAAPPPMAPSPAAPMQPYTGRPGQVVGATGGENQRFLADLAQLAGYEHAPVQINSGYRSRERQAELYANRASNPNPVAPPGHSLHERGLAADGTVGGRPLGTLPAAVLARFGLRTVPGDPVHVELLR